MLHGNAIGALRSYTSQPWVFTLDYVNFVQAVAQIAGMAIETSRLYKGLKGSIETLKMERDPKTLKSRKWTPYEGVPVSIAAEPIKRRLRTN